MQVKIGIRFHCTGITHFVINRLYAYVKQIICEIINSWYKFMYKRLFTKNCITRWEILSVSLSHMLFFISVLDCCFQRSEFTNNLLCQNEQGGNNHKNINITLQFYWSSVIPTLPSAKTIKILRSLRKFKHARHLHWPKALYFPCADAQNSQYLVY